MKERKIEAWTGPLDDDGSELIGALVQRADGSIKQIDDSLSKALIGDVPSGPSLGFVDDLIARLRSSYPNVHLEFPWEGADT